MNFITLAAVLSHLLFWTSVLQAEDGVDVSTLIEPVSALQTDFQERSCIEFCALDLLAMPERQWLHVCYRSHLSKRGKGRRQRGTNDQERSKRWHYERRWVHLPVFQVRRPSRTGSSGFG